MGARRLRVPRVLLVLLALLALCVLLVPSGVHAQQDSQQPRWSASGLWAARGPAAAEHVDEGGSDTLVAVRAGPATGPGAGAGFTRTLVSAWWRVGERSAALLAGRCTGHNGTACTSPTDPVSTPLFAYNFTDPLGAATAPSREQLGWLALETNGLGVWVLAFAAPAASSEPEAPYGLANSTTQVFVTRSDDDGATWEPARPLHQDFGALVSAHNATATHPSLVHVPGTSRFVILFTSNVPVDFDAEQLGPDFDLFTSASENNGSDWYEPWTMFWDEARDRSNDYEQDELFPQLAVHGSRLYAAWATGRPWGWTDDFVPGVSRIVASMNEAPRDMFWDYWSWPEPVVPFNYDDEVYWRLYTANPEYDGFARSRLGPIAVEPGEGPEDVRDVVLTYVAYNATHAHVEVAISRFGWNEWHHVVRLSDAIPAPDPAALWPVPATDGRGIHAVIWDAASPSPQVGTSVWYSLNADSHRTWSSPAVLAHAGPVGAAFPGAAFDKEGGHVLAFWTTNSRASAAFGQLHSASWTDVARDVCALPPTEYSDLFCATGAHWQARVWATWDESGANPRTVRIAADLYFDAENDVQVYLERHHNMRLTASFPNLYAVRVGFTLCNATRPLLQMYEGSKLHVDTLTSGLRFDTGRLAVRLAEDTVLNVTGGARVFHPHGCDDTASTTECPAGYAWSETSSECAACPSGSYCPTPGSLSPVLPCPPTAFCSGGSFDPLVTSLCSQWVDGNHRTFLYEPDGAGGSSSREQCSTSDCPYGYSCPPEATTSQVVQYFEPNEAWRTVNVVYPATQRLQVSVTCVAPAGATVTYVDNRFTMPAWLRVISGPPATGTLVAGDSLAYVLEINTGLVEDLSIDNYAPLRVEWETDVYPGQPMPAHVTWIYAVIQVLLMVPQETSFAGRFGDTLQDQVVTGFPMIGASTGVVRQQRHESDPGNRDSVHCSHHRLREHVCPQSSARIREREHAARRLALGVASGRGISVEFGRGRGVLHWSRSPISRG